MVMSYLVPFAVFVCVLLGFFWVLRTFSRTAAGTAALRSTKKYTPS